MPATLTINSSISSPAVDWGSATGRLAVKPRTACNMLDVGMTRLYELLNSGELVSYTDGKSRKITVASIHEYVRRRIEASSAGANAVKTA
jgi:excisionase family DNA binding protein